MGPNTQKMINIVTTLVRNADRMMCSAALLDEGIELTFADGCSGLVPFGALPDVIAGGGARQLELPNPYEMVVVMADGESAQIPWDFARHYCDPSYRPRIAAVAQQRRESLGRRVRKLRDAAGLTQEGLAVRASIGWVTLARIESGQQSPRFKTLTAIAGALNLPVDDLILLFDSP